MIADGLGRAIAFRLAPGQAHELPDAIPLLDTLPGVGPATAAKIIAWREQNGRFESIEDLLDVGGIGESKFESLRDLVTV